MATQLKLQVVLDAMDRITAPLKRIQGGAGQAGQQLKALRDRMKEMESAQKNIGEFRDLSRGLANTRNSLAQAQDRVRSLAQEMRSSTAPTAAMRREFNAAVRDARSLSAQHDQQRLKLQQVRSSLSAAGISTSSLAQTERRLRSDMADTNKQIDAQRQRLGRLAEQTRKMAAAREKFSKTREMAGNLTAAGAGAGAVGYGILRGGAALMGEGMEFDQSMSAVQALARLDKNSPELKAMRQQARDLGAATMFSATDAAEGQRFLAMAGFTPDKIMGAMPGLLDLAKAGSMELGEAADVSSNILTGFNLKADEMGKVSDVLAATFTRSNTSLYMLGETMKYVAPGAAAFGQDIETMAAAAGKLGDAGIQGSMGGTALRAILSRLAAPPKMAADAMEQLGLDAKDAAGNMRPLPDILAEIYEKTQGMGNAERGGLLKAIAGEEAGSGLTVLVEQAGTGGLQELIQKNREAAGEAAQVAKTMGDNLTGDLDELSSGWSDIKISLFDDNIDAMRGTVQMLTNMTNAVGEWIKNNPVLVATLSKIIVVVGLLAAAVSAVSLSLAAVLVPMAAVRFAATALGIKMGGAISLLRGGIGALRAGLPVVLTLIRSIGVALVSNPIGAVVTGIALAAMLIYRYWGPIRAFFAGVFQGIWSALAPLREAMAAVWSAWSAALSPLASLVQGIGSAIGSVINWIGRLFSPSEQSSESLEKITSAGQRVGQALGAVFQVLLFPLRMFATVAQGVALLVSGSWSELGDLLGGIFGGLGGIAEAAWARVSGAARAGLDYIGSMVASAGSAITSGAAAAWDGLAGMFSGLWDRAKASTSEGLAAIGQALGSLSPLPALQSAFDGALSWLANDLPARFASVGSDVMNGLVQGIQGMGSAVKNAVTGMGQNVMDWFRDKLGIHSPSRVFIGYGENVSQGAGEGIQRGSTSALQSVRQLAASVAAAGVMAPIAAPSMAAVPAFTDTPASVTAAAPREIVRPALAGTESGGVLSQIGEAFSTMLDRAHGIVSSITSDLRIDQRPPVSAARTAAPVTYGGDTIEIHIHPAAGADPQAIAQAVRAELDRRDRERAARRLSAMTDYGD